MPPPESRLTHSSCPMSRYRSASVCDSDALASIGSGSSYTPLLVQTIIFTALLSAFFGVFFAMQEMEMEWRWKWNTPLQTVCTRETRSPCSLTVWSAGAFHSLLLLPRMGSILSNTLICESPFHFGIYIHY